MYFCTEMKKNINWVEYQKHAYSYGDYLALIDNLLAQGKTTGSDQTESHLETAPLNRQRMKRLDKTIKLSEEMLQSINQIGESIDLYILTEGWCGDASQNLPYIHQIANASKGKIKDYYLLRDEHPELMDQFLTNNARAIPKAIAIDSADGNILFTWGPRPEAIQKWFLEMKLNSGLAKDEISKELHTHYTINKGLEVYKDFIALFASIK